MGLYFRRVYPDRCCLCESGQLLTGEHKIKASALRQELGAGPFYLGVIDSPTGEGRFVQGRKSKRLHFKARLCKQCNSSRTQPADMEFERFNGLTRAAVESGQPPWSALEDPIYSVGGNPYLNLFRYFAKLLACHIADALAPVPRELGDFATSRSPRNIVKLEVRKDPAFDGMIQRLGGFQYAAHGGLQIAGKRSSGTPTAFCSSLTIGPIQYFFFIALPWPAVLELRFLHRDFYNTCRVKVRLASRHPPTTEESS